MLENIGQTATPPAAQTAGVAFRGVTVIDVTDGSLHQHWAVLVVGDRIAAVGPTSEVATPAGTEIVDGAGKFLIPGLWDMHVHTSWKPTVWAYDPLFIANGITGVRDMFGLKSVAAEAQAAVKSGRVVGPPRLVLAGVLIDGPGRLVPQSLSAVTPEDGRKFVDSLHADGEPFLKVDATLLPDTYLAIGLTPLQALQAATINPARYVERTGELGTVTAGTYADLVLLDANPSST